MTIRRYSDNDAIIASYKQTSAGLEKEALDALKKADLKAVKEAVLGVQGELTGIAKQVAGAAAQSSGPVRDRLLAAGPSELEAQIEKLSTKVSQMIDTRRGEAMTVGSADLLANLRDAARDEDPKAIARALVGAVSVRNVSYGEWRGMLDKMSTVKASEGDLTHLSNRDAKRALVSDLVKLFYLPLISEVGEAKKRLDALVDALPRTSAPSLFESIAFTSETRSVFNGQPVFRERQPGSSVFLVLEGTAKGPNDKTFGAGSFLGLSALTPGNNLRRETIVGGDGLKVMELTPANLQALEDVNPRIMTYLRHIE